MSSRSRKRAGKMDLLSSLEMGEMRYHQGLCLMQLGRFREAINSFGKSSFFMPEKPQPFIAAAECYLTLCDFQGAVKQYRRALWLLRPTDDVENIDSQRFHALRLGGVLSSPNLDMATSTLSEADKWSRPNSEGTGSFLRHSRTISPTFSDVTKAPMSVSATGVAMSTESDSVLLATVRSRLAGILDALSIVLFNAKDYVQALRFADDSLELFEHPQVMLHRCGYLVALERYDEAEKALEKHLKDYPHFLIESTSLLVHLYSQRQAFQHAKALLDDIPLQDRQHSQILLAQHIFDRAYSFFRQRSIEQSDVQGLTRCLAVFPEDPTLSFERAKHYIGKGMDKKAVPDLFRCIKLSDGGYKAAVELMTETLFRLGASHDGSHGIKSAIDYYSVSLLWYANNIPVLLARGDCYTKLGDYQNALQDYLSVERVSPKHPEAVRRIAFLHDVWGLKFHSLRKLAEAEREFSQAIATYETEPLFFYHRACCRFDMGEPRYALRDVLSCQELNPTDPTIRDFINGHLPCINTGPVEKPSGRAILPKMPSPVIQRATALYGSDRNKAARRLQHQSRGKSQAVDSDADKDYMMRTADPLLQGGGGGWQKGNMDGNNFVHALDGVLTCTKAKISASGGKPNTAKLAHSGSRQTSQIHSPKKTSWM